MPPVGIPPSIADLEGMTQERRVRRAKGIDLGVRLAGSGPLVVLVHGFPDSWISWRSQIPALVAAGYSVAALETRGYGSSSKPTEIERYTLTELADDIMAVLDSLEVADAVLVGHDWGGAQVLAASLIHPERVRGVVSFAFTAALYSDVRPLEMWASTYTDRLFYVNYFATPGLAEAELEADPERTLRLFLYALAGDRPADVDGLVRGRGAHRLLDGLPDPDPFPSWLGPEELAYYSEQFARGGFRGPLNRYRAQDLDVEQMRPWSDQQIDQPLLWIGGELDPARHIVPGVDKYLDPVPRATDVRGQHLLEGIGHWIQQEAPEESNMLLLQFLADVVPTHAPHVVAGPQNERRHRQ